MSLTLLPPFPPIKVRLWHISCALPAMNRPLPAELKFREHTDLILLYYCWCHVTLILHKPNNPLRWTVRASPKGVGRREGLLYYGFRT